MVPDHSKIALHFSELVCPQQLSFICILPHPVTNVAIASNNMQHEQAKCQPSFAILKNYFGKIWKYLNESGFYSFGGKVYGGRFL